MKKVFLILVLFIFLFIKIISASNVGLIENSTWEQNLTPVRFSATALGDINNDGRLDLVLMGCLPGAGGDDCDNGVISKIYINNGSTLTENLTWEQNLTNLGYGSLSLGDINNDGRLDLTITGCTTGTNWGCNGNIISKIYINNGTSFVENSTWQNNLTAVYDSSMQFGDINNDGKNDLIINGAKQTLPFYTTKVYVNNGTSFVESSKWEQDLAGVYGGQVSLGDINNDGLLDLALTGDAGSSDKTSKIYINNGTSFVESLQWGNNLTLLSESTVLLGDHNNDGKLDLILTGNAAGDFIYVYNNNGTTLIENQTRDLPGDLIGVYFASLAFGDYNNDGYLDLAEIGNEHGYARIYENNQSNYNYFVQDSIAFANISNQLNQGAITWSDINNDGKLDLIIAGEDFALGTSIAKVYINNNTISNTLPTPPNTLISSYSNVNNTLTLGWNNGSDAETNVSAGLYYNLMIGNSTTNNTIVSGVYGGSSGGSRSGGASNGYFGNMMQRKNITLNLALPAGTYYWYVQTIDTGLAKSDWSARQTITVNADSSPPNISSISSSVTSSSATITWTTDEMGNSTVYYGTTNSTTSKSSDVSLTQSHSITLNSLSASTLYYYNVSSCDYSGNCNTSQQKNFTTSDATQSQTPPGGGGGSGGTTTSFWTKTEVVNEANLSNGIEKEMGTKQRVQFNVSGEEHYIGVINVNATLGRATINISSNPIQITLGIGEEAKINVSNSNFYDIYVKLISILNNKVNLTIQAIHEEIPGSNATIGTNGTIVNNGNEKENQNANKLVVILTIVVGTIILIFAGILIHLLIKRKKHMKKYIKMLNKRDKEKKK